MNKLLLCSVENCPVVSGQLWCRLIDQPWISLNTAFHLEINHTSQLHRILGLLQEELICDVASADINRTDYFHFRSHIGHTVDGLGAAWTCHRICRGRRRTHGCCCESSMSSNIYLLRWLLLSHTTSLSATSHNAPVTWVVQASTASLEPQICLMIWLRIIFTSGGSSVQRALLRWS